ncbi:MAG: SDR family NAD(P)-dependent oxidoreductase, partial [Candidatus Izimaplasma sp.]|nr:SDR family NAD(P)-dependent oxidoreductase [Candidatus Izimaplasma bacterium]
YPKEEYSFDYYLCDLSNSKEISKTTTLIKEKYKKIDVLINSAGMGISGALELTPLEEIIEIFQVNLFGLMQITKELIPALREAASSKIINIGSVAGELSLPFQTVYTMTKSSTQRYTEGLRLELKPFKISACTVLPGDTKTSFTENRVQPKVLSQELYQSRITNSIRKMEIDEQKGMSPMSVVRVVNKLVERRKMPVQVTVGFKYKMAIFLNRILPKKLALYIIYQIYGK